MKHINKSYLISFLSFFCLISSRNSYAAGFGVKLDSAVLAGQANAGSAVINDPLAIFTNPASTIQQCNMGFALQGTGVFPNTRFKGTTTDPLIPNVSHTIKSRQAGKNALIPSGAFTARINDRIALGIISAAPFGLAYDYGRNWGGNRYGIISALETINFTPTLALKLHDMLSVGAGVQVQRSQAVLSSQMSNSNSLVQFLFQEAGTNAKAKVHGWGQGWTAGGLLQPISPLKIGFSYRSEIHTSLKGDVKFRNVPLLLANNPLLQNTKAKSKIKYPRTFTLSASYDISSKWTTLFDIIRTNWSSVKQIVLSTPIDPQLQIIQQKWKNTWFFSAGVNYQYDLCWLFRAGIAYDQKASRTQFRTPGIPDNDKIWTAMGFTYLWDKKLSTSLSYGHEFFRKSRINLLNTNLGNAGKGNLNGRVPNHINLVSLQVNYQF